MQKRIVACLSIAFFLCPLFSSCKKREEQPPISYRIVGEYFPEERTVKAEMQVSVENRTDNALTEYKFELYPNAYKEDAVICPVSPLYEKTAYYDGKSYGEIRIKSVDGAKSYHIGGKDDNILYLQTETVYPDERANFTIEFETQLAKVEHRTGVTERCANLCDFYPVLCHYGENGFEEYTYEPIGEPFVYDTANYSVTLTLPSGYVVASSGVEEKRTNSDGKTTVEYSVERARDFAVCCSKDFKVETVMENGKTFSYYYLSDETPMATLYTAKSAVEFYSEQFGEYPYSAYSVVQTETVKSGTATALCMLSTTLNETEKNRTLVHETAHEWWNIVVGTNRFSNAWQSEGLAEYSSALFFDANSTYGFTKKDMVETALKEYRSYYNIYSRVFGTAKTVMERPLYDYVSEYEYDAVVKNKGLVFFDELADGIGKKKFQKGLKRYFTDCAFKVAGSGDLIGAMEKSGVDVHGIFDSYIQGKVIL